MLERFLAQRTGGPAQPPAQGMDYHRVDALLFPDLTTATGSEQGGDRVDEP